MRSDAIRIRSILPTNTHTNEINISTNGNLLFGRWFVYEVAAKRVHTRRFKRLYTVYVYAIWIDLMANDRIVQIHTRIDTIYCVHACDGWNIERTRLRLLLAAYR